MINKKYDIFQDRNFYIFKNHKQLLKLLPKSIKV